MNEFELICVGHSNQAGITHSLIYHQQHSDAGLNIPEEIGQYHSRWRTRFAHWVARPSAAIALTTKCQERKTLYGYLYFVKIIQPLNG